jgi:hypothetical protein
MSLQIIGAGLGRTGTVSLKLALEHIGFGPCYHAMEIVASGRKSIPLWDAAIDGHPDWDAIFDGYVATTDYPGCCFWRELLDHFPDAKVILSLRDADSWFESISATLFSPEHLKRVSGTPMEKLNGLFRRDLGGRFGERDFMTDYFNRWNQAVIDTVPADRLLVFSAGEGWGPICDFLGVRVPDAPYPRANSRDELNNFAAGSDGAPPNPAEMERKLRAHIDHLRQSAFGPVS